MKLKKIMVTGGEGFIGSALIDDLVRSGHSVASLDAKLNFINNPPYYAQCLRMRRILYKRAEKYYRADIRNIKSIEKAVNEFKPEIIVHLAGLAMARPLAQYRQLEVPINLAGTLNVLDVFEQSKAEKIIYTSSSMAYGHFMQTPQSENFMLNPINAYGAAKASGEYFVKLSQKDWVILRPTSVYGFADCAYRVSQLLIDAAFTGKPAWVVSGETLDFSYVDDVVQGFILAMFSPHAIRQTFNISRGIARSAQEYAQIVQTFFPDFIFDVRNPQKEQVYRGPQDISKAEKMLGFSPKYTIEDGIGKIIEFASSYNFYKNGKLK